VAMFCTSCVLVQEAASLDPPLWYAMPTFYSYWYGGETLCMLELRMPLRQSVGQEGGSRGSSRRSQPASDKIWVARLLLFCLLHLSIHTAFFRRVLTNLHPSLSFPPSLPPARDMCGDMATGARRKRRARKRRAIKRRTTRGCQKPPTACCAFEKNRHSPHPV
jgi:hypothetical protein